jgi:[acyl-carrier-protein] S-malonyltransferase
VTLAILCSGQGGQHAGMFDLIGNAPQAAALFDHAATLLSADPRELVRSAEHARLYQNRTAQLLCSLQTLCAIAALDDVLPRQRCVAGYSVGEIAAWGASGLIDPSTTLDLVLARADAMNVASGGDEGMLFVRGLDEAAIEKRCANREAAIAIVNPGDAWVIAGRLPALADIATEARQLGASRVAMIPVAVASHTYLLADASNAFRHRLADVDVQPSPHLGTRLLSGIDGSSVLNVREGLDKLAAQISHPVQWAACLESCVEAGAVAFLELGPGRALAEMASATYTHLPARSLDDFRSLQGVHTWLARVANGE